MPRVIGYSLKKADGIQALKVAAITELAESPGAVARDAELVVLAVPPQPTLDLLGSLGPQLSQGAILSDVCSVKAPIVEQALATGLGDRFVGAHPLAGTHETGFAAARPDRFRGCVVYICETGSPKGHRAAAVVADFWETALEAAPVRIEPEAHDRQLAWTSHLPQAIAYVLAKALSTQGLGGVSFGSGAKDTMRLAASSPELWVDVFQQNVTPLAAALEQLGQEAAELRRLLSAGDADGLRQYLEAARSFRQGLDR